MKHAEIKKLSHEMRLLGIHESIERRLAQAAANNLSMEEFLIHLLEDEKQNRKNRIANALDKKAKFRRESMLENWDFSIDRGITKTKIRELATLSFWHNKKNLLIIGPTGSGKTQLSIALGKVACQMQLSVLFIAVNQLFEDAMAQRAAGKYTAWAKNMKKYDLIIFDDFGLRSYTHDEAILLVDLIEDRYQKTAHIFSSQVDTEGWKSLFEDPVIADALIDRIKSPCEKITLTGPSYRDRLGGKQINAPTPLDLGKRKNNSAGGEL